MTADLASTPRLLHSIKHAAAELDVSPNTVKTLIRDGDLASVMLRGRRLVAHEDLIAYVARLRRSA